MIRKEKDRKDLRNRIKFISFAVGFFFKLGHLDDFTQKILLHRRVKMFNIRAIPEWVPFEATLSPLT